MRFPVRLSPPATAAAATAGAVLAAVALRRYLRTRSSMATSAHRRQRQWNHPRGLRQVHGGPASPRRRRRRARSRGGRLRRGYHRVARLRRGRGRGRGLRRRRLHGGAPGVPLREVDALVAQAGLHARPRDAVGARFAWFFLGAVWIGILLLTPLLLGVCRNFAKLPVGVVCVADVQFKGRG